MKLKYSDIENGVRDYLKLLGRETNQNIINILSEFIILHCYSSSNEFELLFVKKFIDNVTEYIQFNANRDHCEFEFIANPSKRLPALLSHSEENNDQPQNCFNASNSLDKS